MANIKITLPEFDLGKVDTKITTYTPKGAKIGELHISKGSVEWWPSGNHVNGKTMTWLAFAKFFEAQGRELKVVKPTKKVKPKTSKLPSKK